MDSHARSRVPTSVRSSKASQIRKMARLEVDPGGLMPNRRARLSSLECGRSRVQVKDFPSVASPGFPRIAAINISCLDKEFSGT